MKGSWESPHRFLKPHDRGQNYSRQGILCSTHGIRRERQKVVVKLIGCNRNYIHVVRIFTRVKVRTQAQESSRIEW